MKDTFDIRAYLTENKLTEATRVNRTHFGKTILNDNVILEGLYDVDPDRDGFECWCRDQGINPDSAEGRMARRQYDDELAQMNECDAAMKAEYEQYAAKYGEDKAKKIMAKFHPECNLDEVNDDHYWHHRDDDRIADDNVRDNMYADNPIDEVGYTDDEDDDYVDDYIGARGSNADLGIANDKRAAAAAKKGMVGTDLDVDAPEEGPEYPDQPNDAEDFQDPEDMEAPEADSVAPSSDIDTAKIFGKNAPYVEVLVDDLEQYLRGPKGKWRINVSTNLLRRAIDSVRAYMEEYTYPRKGFLLAPNKMGNYDEIPVLGNNTLDSNPKAVVWVHREPINEA